MEKNYEIFFEDQSFGVYAGETPADALDRQAKDAGYHSYAKMLEITGQTDETYMVKVNIVEVE